MKEISPGLVPIGLAALLATVATVPQATAATATRDVWRPGGADCQLSVPTTDTGVRPRASGMRNE